MAGFWLGRADGVSPIRKRIERAGPRQASEGDLADGGNPGVARVPWLCKQPTRSGFISGSRLFEGRPATGRQRGGNFPRRNGEGIDGSRFETDHGLLPMTRLVLVLSDRVLVAGALKRGSWDMSAAGRTLRRGGCFGHCATNLRVLGPRVFAPSGRKHRIESTAAEQAQAGVTGSAGGCWPSKDGERVTDHDRCRPRRGSAGSR